MGLHTEVTAMMETAKFKDPTRKAFQCNVCDRRFQHHYTLQLHMRVHSGNRPYVCKKCNMAFVWKSLLDRHEAVHTGNKPFKCKHCSKGFCQRTSLVHHERTHTGEKPFVCTECPKRFAQKGHLKEHEKTHSGERPYVCHHCNKGFTSRGNLNQHKKIHTGERPYICGLCFRTFTQKIHLKDHMKRHNGDGQFVCEICYTGFVSRESLTLHAKGHTEERLQYCETCGRHYSQQVYLKQHKRCRPPAALVPPIEMTSSQSSTQEDSPTNGLSPPDVISTNGFSPPKVSPTNGFSTLGVTPSNSSSPTGVAPPTIASLLAGGSVSAMYRKNSRSDILPQQGSPFNPNEMEYLPTSNQLSEQSSCPENASLQMGHQLTGGQYDVNTPLDLSQKVPYEYPTPLFNNSQPVCNSHGNQPSNNAISNASVASNGFHGIPQHSPTPTLKQALQSPPLHSMSTCDNLRAQLSHSPAITLQSQRIIPHSVPQQTVHFIPANVAPGNAPGNGLYLKVMPVNNVNTPRYINYQATPTSIANNGVTYIQSNAPQQVFRPTLSTAKDNVAIPIQPYNLVSPAKPCPTNQNQLNNNPKPRNSVGTQTTALIRPSPHMECCSTIKRQRNHIEYLEEQLKIVAEGMEKAMLKNESVVSNLRSGVVQLMSMLDPELVIGSVQAKGDEIDNKLNELIVSLKGMD